MFKAFNRTHLYLGGVILAAIITAVISAVLVIIDQVIKYFVLGNLHSGDNVPFIGNLLTLTYVENRGAVFGIMQNMSWLFAIITILMIALFFYVIIKKKITNKLFPVSYKRNAYHRRRNRKSHRPTFQRFCCRLFAAFILSAGMQFCRLLYNDRCGTYGCFCTVFQR